MWRRDSCVVSSLRPVMLMPPLVQVAETSAFAVSGSVRVTPPLVVPRSILSLPSDARSTVTCQLVVRASTAPVRSVPVTPPLVVRADTRPFKPLRVTLPLVVIALMTAPFGAFT